MQAHNNRWLETKSQSKDIILQNNDRRQDNLRTTGSFTHILRIQYENIDSEPIRSFTQ